MGVIASIPPAPSVDGTWMTLQASLYLNGGGVSDVSPKRDHWRKGSFLPGRGPSPAILLSDHSCSHNMCRTRWPPHLPLTTHPHPTGAIRRADSFVPEVRRTPAATEELRAENYLSRFGFSFCAPCHFQSPASRRSASSSSSPSAKKRASGAINGAAAPQRAKGVLHAVDYRVPYPLLRQPAHCR